MRNGETNLTICHRFFDKHLTKRAFQALPQTESSNCLSTVSAILHTFPIQFLHKQYVTGDKNMGLREIKWHGDTDSEDKFNQGQC